MLGAAVSAQFRVDPMSGSCYVRTGQGEITYLDRTKMHRLPVYKEDNSQRRAGLKKRKIRQGFARPPVYGQHPRDPRRMVQVTPERRTEEVELYIVEDGSATDSYYWEYVQESWTEVVDDTYNTTWSRCNCRSDEYGVQRIVSVLTEDGLLPPAFVWVPDDRAARAELLGAVRAYAEAYDLPRLLSLRLSDVHVPLAVLDHMDLTYLPTLQTIRPVIAKR